MMGWHERSHSNPSSSSNHIITILLPQHDNQLLQLRLRVGVAVDDDWEEEDDIAVGEVVDCHVWRVVVGGGWGSVFSEAFLGEPPGRSCDYIVDFSGIARSVFLDLIAPDCHVTPAR
eukprot:scaffold31301_cov72-Skeletonema_dohrnii-CCMP3373.AAC.1